MARNPVPMQPMPPFSGITGSSGYLGQIILLAIAQAVLMLGYGVIMPILPFYLTFFGGGAFEYGLLIATFSLCAFVSAGPMGILSDRIGRKPVILLSLIGASIALVSFGLATSIGVLFLTRAVEGLFTAGLYPASDALVSDLAPSEKRGTYLGTLLAGRMSGMIFGPTVGGILSYFMGYRFAFFFCAGLAALAFLLCIIFIRDPSKQPDLAFKVEAPHNAAEPRRYAWKRISKALRKYGGVLVIGGILLAVALIVRFTRIFSIALVEPMFANYATDPRTFGFTALDLGIFFLVFAGANALGQLVFGRLSDTIGHQVPLILSGFVTAVAILSAIIATTPLQLMLIGSAIGVGGAMAMPSSAAIAAEAAPAEDRGLVMGLLSMAGSAGRATGPIIGGASYAFILAITDSPYQAAFLPMVLCAIVSLIGSFAVIPLVFLRYRRNKKALSIDDEEL